MTPSDNGGLPCGDMSETDPCNTQKCPENRAAVLVDRIRKLELQDRINTLEELQAQQASELAASQTADLLSQVGGSDSTGGSRAATPSTSFIEMISSLLERQQQQIQQNRVSDAAFQRKLAALDSFKLSIEKSKTELGQLQWHADTNDLKSYDVPAATESVSVVDTLGAGAGANGGTFTEDEDEVVDEVDAQGHHHQKHHHRRRHANSDSKFSQTAPTSSTPLDPVPPLFGHTVPIPAGNNNDFIETNTRRR